MKFLNLPFPSDQGEQTIEVFHQQGDPAFICGAHGSITGDMIENIEKDFADNPDEGFDRGDGIYLYVPRWESPQVGDFGRIELPGYWDLELVGFKPMEQAMSNSLLAAALDAWGHGVRRWNEAHDSYPAAFNKLAHVMDDIQRHLDAANTRIADTGVAKPEGRT